jgi:hypothetical protein
MFVNAQTHSLADTNRWSIKLEMSYLSVKDEVRLLKTYFPDLFANERSKFSPEKFVNVAVKVREAQKAGKIDYTLSARELVNWVEKFKLFGRGVHYAARRTFLNALEPDVALAITEYVIAEFGSED